MVYDYERNTMAKQMDAVLIAKSCLIASSWVFTKGAQDGHHGAPWWEVAWHLSGGRLLCPRDHQAHGLPLDSGTIAWVALKRRSAITYCKGVSALTSKSLPKSAHQPENDCPVRTAVSGSEYFGLLSWFPKGTSVFRKTHDNGCPEGCDCFRGSPCA